MALNEKQKLFCHEYIKDFNGTRAYSAVYKDSTKDSARADAPRLLANACIQEYMQSLIDPIIAELGINEKYVLEGLKELAENATKPYGKDGELHDDNSAKVKSYELLGKYLKIFTEKIELGGVEDSPPIKIEFVDKK